MKPAKPESRNIYEAQKAGKDVKKLPLSLGEALDRLAEDEVIKSAMPDEMYKVSIGTKTMSGKDFLVQRHNGIWTLILIVYRRSQK